MFQVVWDDQKDNKKFDWKTVGDKHDAYNVKQFGNELNDFNKATSREKGQLLFDDESEINLTPNEIAEKKKKKRAQ